MRKPDDNPFIDNPKFDFERIEDEEEAEQKIGKLREAIRYHDYCYYVENDPVISDRAYDKLFNRLKRLEDEFDLESESSPTQRVGAEPLDEFQTVEHVESLLSIESSQEKDEVIEFDRRVRERIDDPGYYCEPKFDGVSIEIVYENGEFQRAVTRGDGVRGEDVSQNVKTIGAVPLKLRDAPEFLSVRGEIYMPEEAFQELNQRRVERGKDAFANPRNAAAGTLRQLDPEKVADRPLQIFLYDIIDSSEKFQTHSEAMATLEELGFRVNKFNRQVESIEGFIDYREEMMEMREQLDYEIDGVVVKVESIEAREKLGSTSSHPRWAFAYKFPAKTGTTEVEKIVVQVGRTGKLTPVALLKPVDVKGVTISRATLHNEAQAQEKQVRKGARVRIKRAGDVIPEIDEVIEHGNGSRFEMPSKCPVCGSMVVEEGEYHYCTGAASCPAQLKRSLVHYCSRAALDIEGIGEKVAEQLVDECLVEELPDLYSLTVEELVDLDRFGEKSARKLVENIEHSKEPDLASFLTGLGIRHVGSTTARRIVKEFSLTQLRNASADELERIQDIGPETARSIESFFSSRGGDLVEELLERGVEPVRERASDELEGVKLAITGSIEGFTRQELIEVLERNGAEVTSSVSQETDFLVVGENPGQSKLEDADAHGVRRIDEGEFRGRILDRIEL